MAKLNSAEEQALKDISKWKSQAPGFLTKATSTMARPITWAGDNLIPDDAREGLSAVTEILLDKLQDVSQWTVNEGQVLEAARAFEIEAASILELKKASLFDLDHLAEDSIKRNRQLAAAEGFGTGLLGWPGLIADMPALFTLSFRTVYQIALCYGYPADVDLTDEDGTPFELGFMLRIFRVATAATRVDKLEALLELGEYQSRMEPELEEAPHVGGDFAVKQIGKNAAINLSRILINTIVRNTFARKAVTAIPGIGALLTAGFNYSYVKDVGDAAFYLYRERFLLEKKKRRAGGVAGLLFPEK